MTQDKLIEGRAYWVKNSGWKYSYLLYAGLARSWRETPGDDEVIASVDHNGEWILIPSPEETLKQRKLQAEIEALKKEIEDTKLAAQDEITKAVILWTEKIDALKKENGKLKCCANCRRYNLEEGDELFCDLTPVSEDVTDACDEYKEERQ